MDRYEIRIARHLDQRRIHSLGCEELRLLPDGDSTLSFVAVDQAAMCEPQTQLWDAGLEPIAADRVGLPREANVPHKESSDVAG